MIASFHLHTRMHAHAHIPPLIPAHIHSHKCILSLFLSHTHSQTHSFTHTHILSHTSALRFPLSPETGEQNSGNLHTVSESSGSPRGNLTLCQRVLVLLGG